jgi:glutathione peroxidase
MIWASVLSTLRNVFVGGSAPLSGSIFDNVVQNNVGKEVPLVTFRGKKLLIVNTASHCGYTYQLKQLQQLHETYKDKVQVLGFPSNDFWQETDSDNEIASFCELNYGVSFPVFSKIHVLGKNMHPVYRMLLAMSGKLPQWNFCKYLLDEEGNFVEFYNSKVNPLDDKIISRIK